MLLILFFTILLGAMAGTGLVLLWGVHLLERDEVQARSMRAALDINRMVIEARANLLDAAMAARQSRGHGR